MRLFFALVFLALGFFHAWSSLNKEQPVQAFAIGLAGAYMALAVVIGINASLKSLAFNLSASAIGVVGILGTFFYSKAFNYELQVAYLDAMTDIATLELRCKPMTKELRNLQDLGVKACATQRSGDQLGSVIELSKSFYFGPALAIIDSTAASTQDSPPNYCARTVQAIDRHCPYAFSSLGKEGKVALLKAAK